ncbi:hypothetical protein M404DRAFT_845581 [Pisolithus tinctorius Marx 270]|uniref:Uncharacterized protein n=1 Tax=Pisolithus tinctorius Marx 270 TaxID=870435 RepID=A0A0C3INT7_PISTI|nr:hypothetical protein M404DRAFT_845581 [Pisolithus tinctorius Marx 270]
MLQPIKVGLNWSIVLARFSSNHLTETLCLMQRWPARVSPAIICVASRNRRIQ